MGVRQAEGSGADMSRNGPEVPLYRPLGGGGVPYEQWTDDALCNGADYRLFELQDFDEVERGEQEVLIAEGLKICAACPVRQACKSNSNEHDRHWTTRGGQPPEGLFQDSKAPKYQPAANGRNWSGDRKVTPKEKCKRGHNNWAVRADGKRRCVDCRKMDNQKAWDKKSGQRAAVRAKLGS